MTSQDFIQYIKEKYPQYANSYSDDGLYQLGRKLEPNLNVDPHLYKSSSISNYSDRYKRPDNPFVQDISPEKFNGYSNYQLTEDDDSDEGGLGTYFINEDSPAFLKRAYNESLTGLAYQLAHGRQRFEYDTENYNPAIWEDVLGGIIGFVMPLDLLALATGGIAGAGVKAVAGKVATKTTQNLISKGMAKRFSTMNINKRIVNNTTRGFGRKMQRIIQDQAMTSATQQGMQFGIYEGAKKNLHLRNQGVEGRELWNQTFSAFGHGALLGGLAGYGGGLLGGKWSAVGKIFKDKKLRGVRISKNLQKLFDESETVAPLLRRKSLEVGIFTSPAVLDEGKALFEGKSWRDAGSNILRAALTNAGMVGVMHSTSSTLGKGFKKISEFGEKHRKRVMDNIERDSVLNPVEREIRKSIAESTTTSEKKAYEKILESILEEKERKVSEIEAVEGTVGSIKKEIKTVQSEINSLTKKPPKTPGAINAAVEKVATAINVLNKIVGLTGSSELATLVNSYTKSLTNSIKNNVGTNVKTKAQLLSLYKKIRKSSKKNNDVIQVERNGKIETKSLSKDLKDISKAELIKAIENESQNLNHGAAKEASSSAQRNNKVEEYNTTEDFKKGHKSDTKGDREIIHSGKSYNVKDSRNPNKTVKSNSRNAEINKRADNLGSTHKKISNDSGGSEMTYSVKEIYYKSKSILLNTLETVFLDKIIKKGNKGEYKSITSVKNSVESVNNFSKWLAKEKNKNLYEATNADIKLYLETIGNKKDGLILKEFYSDIKSKMESFNGFKTELKYDKFFDYGNVNPNNKGPASPRETAARKREKVLMTEYEFSNAELRDLRKKVVGVENYKDMNKRQQIKFDRYLRKLLNTKLEGRTNQIKGGEIRLKLKAEEMGYSDVVVSDVLRSLGVRGGKVKNVKNPETLRKAESFLTEGLSKDVSPTIIDQIRLQEITKDKMDLKTVPVGLSGKLLGWAMPTWYRMREYVSEKLSSTFLESELMMERVIGEGMGKLADVKRILKTKEERDMLRFVDKERRKEAKTKKEKDFIKKLDEKGTITVDGKKIVLKKGDKLPFDAIIEGGSKQWRASMIDKMGKDRMWETFVSSVKRNATPKQFKIFLENYNRKYVDFYHSRIVNPEVLAAFNKAGSAAEWFIKIVDKELRIDAKAAAIKNKLKPGSPKYNKFIKDYIKNKENRDKKEESLTSYFMSSPSRVPETSFLRERGPEIADKNGMITIETRFGKKKVKAYVEKYDNVMESYYGNMAKAIAGVRFFPEFMTVKLSKGDLGLKGTISKSKVEKLAGQRPEWNYALEAIENHLGIGRHNLRSAFSGKQRLINVISKGVVILGLSTPAWHGLVNFGIGQARNFGAFGAYNTMKGLVAVFNRENWKKAEQKGWLEQGKRSLEMQESILRQELGPLGEAINIKNMFTYWNWMTPFEQINRISSAYGGMHFFEQSLRTYKGEGTFLRKFTLEDKKGFEDMMRNRLKFTENEIRYIKETPIENLLSTKENVTFSYLSEKAATAMHLSTQGGTGVPQLPLWMSQPHLKPLTIFYRIAGNATFDTYINFIKPAVKHGNLYPLMRLAVGHAVSGYALASLYEQMFDQPNPWESIDMKKMSEEDKKNITFSKALFYTHKSGFFGVAEPIFDPQRGIFSGKKMSQTFSPSNSMSNMPVVYPAMLSMGEGLLNNTLQLIFEKPDVKTYAEWTLDRSWNFLKESSSFGAAIRKTNLRLNNNYMQERKKIRSQWRAYLNSIGKSQISKDFQVNEMFEILKVKLTDNNATDESRLKAIMSVYNALVHEAMISKQPGIHPLQAHKDAIRSIKSSMNSLRPIQKSAGQAVTELDMQNFYKTRTKHWQNMIYRTDSEFALIDMWIDKVLSDNNNFRKYSVLGHVANMSKVDYNPKGYFYDFESSLSDEEKQMYKNWRLFY
jgi:hypothetical protein